MSSRRVCSVSVDLDPIRCYYEIHGLPPPGPASADLLQVVMRRAVPRFAELFAARGITATFFVVGEDLASPQAVDAVRAVAAAGHEIGNHSERHFYDLQRRPPDEVRREVEEAHARIASVAGKAPVGFRAPGYGLSRRLLDVLESLGYRYDSSVFPSPPYYTAKAGVMAGLWALGRPSGSTMGDPRGLLAPAMPYRPHPRAPFRRGQSSVVELPISVTPGLRLPAIGTLLLSGPDAVRVSVLEQMRARRFFNFELHGIDLLDAEADGIPSELVARQPDLRRPLVGKVRALAATLERLAAEHEILPLEAVAARVQREGERCFD
jgi:hypothetical protein